MALTFSISKMTAFEIQMGNYTPTPHPKGTWLITASCGGRPRNIPKRGLEGTGGGQNFNILQLFQTIIFTLLNLSVTFFCFV